MPYVLNKTNGNKLTIVDDASLDSTTSLTFVGKNYSGYGEVVNENFVKLLENFSNSSAPGNPIQGQLWFDSTSDIKRLNVYDGKNFRSIANIKISSSAPTSSYEGDLWWDSLLGQLKVFDGSTFTLIGPAGGARASWQPGEETTSTSALVPVIKAVLGKTPIAVVSKQEFTPSVDSDLRDNFPIIKPGITLANSNAATGSSKGFYYFWGTAAESLTANTATTVLSTASNTNTNYYVPFLSTTTGGAAVLTTSTFNFNPNTRTLTASIFSGVATSAQYADLAERYAADQYYEVGTVVVIGGDKEITVTHTHADIAVAGVISNSPAYMMNSEAGTDETHPYVALKGRVPCKVIGSVKKGALLVTSSYPGYAEVMKPGDSPVAVIGKSLEDFYGPKGIVEIKI